MAKAKKVAKKAALPTPKIPAAPELKEVKDSKVVMEKKETKKVAPVSQEWDFPIETGVPMPARATASAQSAYPFAGLQEGNSFHVPHNLYAEDFKDKDEFDLAVKDAKRVIANRLSGAKRRYETKNPDTKFAIRSVDTGVRVWRIAK